MASSVVTRRVVGVVLMITVVLGCGETTPSPAPGTAAPVAMAPTVRPSVPGATARESPRPAATPTGEPGTWHEVVSGPTFDESVLRDLAATNVAVIVGDRAGIPTAWRSPDGESWTAMALAESPTSTFSTSRGTEICSSPRE